PERIDEYAVVANLPNAISSAWLESLLATGRLPLRMVLMLQKEALDRMWADCGTKNYNALSIFLRASFESGTRHLVSRQCFYPAPGVDSVLARMDRLPSPFLFADPTRALIRKIFTRRRKQIGSLATREEASERDEILAWLESEGIRPSLRPEQIEPQAWVSLGRRD
ncbi:MAG: rRNA adenine N-6-methyltransferase family protein, partial [Verrucomicrobiota bacterium]|nr:rRNA adenine N-6-methyltransferase family protein [Verrucomicrobiota bacterium]